MNLTQVTQATLLCNFKLLVMLKHWGNLSHVLNNQYKWISISLKSHTDTTYAWFITPNITLRYRSVVHRYVNDATISKIDRYIGRFFLQIFLGLIYVIILQFFGCIQKIVLWKLQCSRWCAINPAHSILELWVLLICSESLHIWA